MESSGMQAQAQQGVTVNPDGSNVYIVQPGQAVGWGAVEKAVREDDELQVRSCKEDIDTLLTFSGLYSAALTALLALSFNMLQEDTAGESLLVLRQIAQQTATYQLLPSGLLNTTNIGAPPSSTPFQPSQGALRVNILWFASLVFSLSTASIGILVKQWLRAYTTYQTSSAQGRMRVRHFRRQGLETWKVYEIAAVLPFLIQIALGLFFVGLCYFTAEVHPDLAHTTLPLVAGWAFFIFVVTILPLVSSHCPYKPASFEGLFSVLRRRFFSMIASLKLHDGFALWAMKRTPDCADKDRPYDETDALKYEDKDVEILVAADALQSDDELLGTAILEALKQSQLDITQIVTFILGALQSRLPGDKQLRIEDDPTEMDFRSLTFRARNATTDILSQTPNDQISECLDRTYASDQPLLGKELRWILCILLSPSQYPLSVAGLRFLGSCLTRDVSSMNKVVSFLRSQFQEQPQNILHTLLSAIRHACLEKNLTLDAAVHHTMDALDGYFGDAGLPNKWSVAAFYDDDNENADTWKNLLNESTLATTVIWLAERLIQEVQIPTSAVTHNDVTPNEAASLRTTLGLIFRLSTTIYSEMDRYVSERTLDVLGDLVDKVLSLRSQSSEHFECILWCYISQPGVFVELAAVPVIRNKYMMPENAVDSKGLPRLYQTVTSILSGKFHPLNWLKVVHLCYAISYMLVFGILQQETEVNSTNLDPVSLRMWRRIFRKVTLVLEATEIPEGGALSAEDRRLVDLCFHWTHKLDTGEYCYAGNPSSNDPNEELAWRQDFEPAKSPISNHFISLLSRFYRGDEPYWRLRMLEAMTEEERLAAIRDDDGDDLEEDPSRTSQPTGESTAMQERPSGSLDKMESEQVKAS